VLIRPVVTEKGDAARVLEGAVGNLVAPRSTSTADAADADSLGWLERLRADGPERDRALGELHDLLLGAARFEVNRRRAALPHLRGGDHEDLAQQSANDALVAILAKLDDYRGESRFTTWAYKFALLEAGVKMRRRAWHDREVSFEAAEWPALADPSAAPHRDAQMAELLEALRDAIADDLTPHQRNVLVAVTLNGVPIDVLADRMATTRGALYKTLHDARRRLRSALAERGLEAP
jgi:RNA polymerase sigma-70 factor (ECF subfamily)